MVMRSPLWIVQTMMLFSISCPSRFLSQVLSLRSVGNDLLQAAEGTGARTHQENFQEDQYLRINLKCPF